MKYACISIPSQSEQSEIWLLDLQDLRARFRMETRPHVRIERSPSQCTIRHESATAELAHALISFAHYGQISICRVPGDGISISHGTNYGNRLNHRVPQEIGVSDSPGESLTRRFRPQSFKEV
jgi:hypothetical protein